MAGTTTGFEANIVGKDVNLVLYQGKTISIPLIWGGATPIDVTGFSARMDIRSSASAATAEASFTVANSRVTIGTTDGAITFSMTATDSADLTPGNYIYDIEVIDGSGNVSLAMSGKCDIIAEVTK